MMNNRRNFIKKGMLGLVAGSTLSFTKAHASPVNKTKEDAYKLGIAGYTFRHFDLDEALEMMEKVDVKYLCIKDFHLPLDSTSEEIASFHRKLKDHGVTGYAVGPIYTKTREEIDNVFEYAKRVGVDMVVGIAAHEDLEYVDSKVKEYDIRYAIHNHGPEDELYPNATSIVNLVKDMDPRIGLCFDIGHNMRDGHDPVRDLEKYSDRIFDMHLKDVSAAEAEGKTVELGRGVIDIPAYIKMMRKVNYTGVCSLEYEKDMKEPMAGISESIGYFRGAADATA
jgi:sugar phosphate isomerase/epimerase